MINSGSAGVKLEIRKKKTQEGFSCFRPRDHIEGEQKDIAQGQKRFGEERTGGRERGESAGWRLACSELLFSRFVSICFLQEKSFRTPSRSKRPRFHSWIRSSASWILLVSLSRFLFFPAFVFVSAGLGPLGFQF